MQSNSTALKKMRYQVMVYCISDIGHVRQNNEDSWKYLADKQFYVLADGMGGHQAGEIASKEAVTQLCELFQEKYHRLQSLSQSMIMLKSIICQVNASIYRMGNETAGCKGMGTTLCCILLHPEGLIYAHAGDSRIYRCRKGRLEQLTRDHSLLSEMIDLGHIGEENAEKFLYKNIITKAVGTSLSMEPAVNTCPVEAGDLFMLCTDGLTDLVKFNEIQKIINETPPEELARVLVDTAKINGGYDNITVIIIIIENIENEYHLS